MLNRILAPVAVATFVLATAGAALAGDLGGAFSAQGAPLAVDQAPRWADLRERMGTDTAPAPAPVTIPATPTALDVACKTARPAKGAAAKAGDKRMTKSAPTKAPRPTSCAALLAKSAPVPAPTIAAGDWTDRFAEARGLAGRDRVFAVDAVVNALPYVSDRQNWGVADRWETPQEMFARGGDCEGFALTKYFALTALGVASSDMRVAVVWDRRDREEHAVLLVRDGATTWVLDNKTEAPTRLSADPDRYRLIYAIGPDGARLAPAAETGTPRARVVNSGRTLVLNVTPRHRAGPRTSLAAEVLPAGQ